MKRIVVAGIDTAVGKTVVSAVLTKMFEGCYWKPIQCGTPFDAEWVKQHTNRFCHPSRFVFQAPCSPHLAARKEGVQIRAHQLEPPQHHRILIIEGTGGILAPLNETETWVDAALLWQAHWILVHRHYLGSLNHFLLTIEALKKRRIPLLGIIFNGEGDPSTEAMLLQKTKRPCLGRLLIEPSFTKDRIEEIATTWKPLWQTALGV